MAGELFRDLELVCVYIDDVVIRTQKIEQHVGDVSIICERIRKAGLKLKFKSASSGGGGGN